MQESVKAWRRRWRKLQQVRSRKWRYRHIPAIRRIIFSVLVAILIDLSLLGLVVAIGLYRLLNAQTIVSVVLPEVGIAVILYYFLGQGRREHLGEIADTMDIYSKVSHLKVYTFLVWGAPFYYVENTITRQAYRASEFVEKVIDQNILQPIICRSEKEMKRILRSNGTKLNEDKPSLEQLFDKQ